MTVQNENNLLPQQIHFLRTLLDGKREVSETEAQTRKKHLGIEAIEFPLSVISVSPYFQGVPYEIKDEIIEDCSVFICRFLQKGNYKYICLTNSYDNYQILLPTDANGLSADDLDGLFVRLRQKISQHFGLNLFIGIGSVVNTYTDISRSAAEAMEMLAYKHQYADRGVINIINTSRFKYYSVYGEDIRFARVIGCFQDRDLGTMSRRLEELTDSVRSRPGVSKTAIKRTILELAVNILHVASNADVDVDAIVGGIDLYNWVLKQNHTEVLTSWLMDLSSALLTQMDKKQEANEKKIIVQATEYIREHLSEANLSLQAVSNAVGLSAAYFGQLFRTEKGVGVNTFITDSRITEAQRLLRETSLKSEDIALQTGFASASYFGRVFKKSVGVTPNAYRQQNRDVE